MHRPAPRWPPAHVPADSAPPRRAASLALLLALACTRAPEPALPASSSPATHALAPSTNPSPPPSPQDLRNPRESPEPAPQLDPPQEPTPPAPRPCKPNERLDTGCECREGACFDLCCGPDAGCAHPAEPGGPSACILQPRPAKPTPCKDGDLLASGCRCEGRTCMDLCCVGSACSHRAGPEGGTAKCVTLPRRPG